MGCTSSDISHYEMEKAIVEWKIRIEENDFQMKMNEKDIKEIDNKIKKGEADIKLYKNQYSEDEINYKLSKLLELKRDRLRTQKSIETTSKYNENAKNNLKNLEMQAERRKNMQLMKKENEIMRKLNNQNYAGILRENLDGLNAQKLESEQLNRDLRRGNDQYAGNDIISVEEYRKQLGLH